MNGVLPVFPLASCPEQVGRRDGIPRNSPPFFLFCLSRSLAVDPEPGGLLIPTLKTTPPPTKKERMFPLNAILPFLPVSWRSFPLLPPRLDAVPLSLKRNFLFEYETTFPPF